jgi:hypothetical protein
LPAIPLVLLATAALTAQTATVEAAAEECRTRPSSTTPPGSHWYYHINRPDNRRCWFLRSQQAKARPLAHQGESSGNRHFIARSTRLLQNRFAHHDRHLRAQMAFVQKPTEPELERATLADFDGRWPDPLNAQALDVQKLQRRLTAAFIRQRTRTSVCPCCAG